MCSQIDQNGPEAIKIYPRLSKWRHGGAQEASEKPVAKKNVLRRNIATFEEHGFGVILVANMTPRGVHWGAKIFILT